eukprot:snap_masked-scaffold_23-processed-gene-3.11-mRNA-1 protein AED:1.00 eAED:1.00 QI:0/-1/0/0/-1/1/1/0/59
MNNIAVFTYTFPSKMSLAMDTYDNENMRYMDRLLWTKLAVKWKMNSDLGKLTQNYSEDF